MEDYRNKLEIPPEGIDTPDGYLYYPPAQGKQTLFLIGSFFSAILLGFLVSSIPGDLSEIATGIIYFIYILIFIMGYSVWVSRISILVFGSFKLPIIRTIYRFLIHREKPGSVHDFLPSREKAIQIMVRAQKYTKAFFILSWLIGVVGGLITTLFNTSLSSTLLFTLVMVSAVTYGYVLSYFGRRGYLPFPEE